MPRNAPRRKLAFALRNGGKSLARPCLTAIDDFFGLRLLVLDPRQRICWLKRLDEEHLEQQWIAEAKRRCDEVRSGRVKPIPAEEVYRRIEPAPNGAPRLRK
jgi:hypothetical protein